MWEDVGGVHGASEMKRSFASGLTVAQHLQALRGLLASVTPVAMLACALLVLSACSTTYQAEPIEAWVVDAESSQPIEGVVVTANWELEIGTVGGNVPVGQIMVMETVTDSKGHFYFPAWGPKTVPSTMPHPLRTQPHLATRDPHILLFKSGYKWMGLENGRYNKGSVRKSEWSGKTIRIERFTGNLEGYAKSLNFFNPRFIREDCNWKNVPQMVLAIDKQAQVFRENGISTPLLSINSLEGISPRDRDRCGSAAAFFGRGIR
jgi:hypothetical protein